MTSARLVYDGLWRTLCPSFGALALVRALRSPLIVPPSSSSPLQHGPAAGRVSGSGKPCLRLQHSAAIASFEYAKPGDSDEEAERSRRRTDADAAAADPVLTQAVAELHRCALDQIDESAREMSVKVLLRAISQIQAGADAYERIVALVRHLVRDRKCPPRIELYEALTMALRSVRGSASALRLLLDEMAELHLDPSPTIYRNAFAALAVHPDYLLRTTVLNQIRNRWGLDDMEEHQNIALGLLRDGQYEMALDKLDEMSELESTLQQKIPAWVLDVFVVACGRAGFLDEAFRVLLSRLRRDYRSPHPQLLYYALDVCSRGLHHAGTKYIWARTLSGSRLNVSDGGLLNVLRTAVRHSDHELASQAVQELSDRGARISLPHFESLVELQATQGSTSGALRTLCIMAKSGFVPSRGSTRVLFRALKTQPSMLDSAFDALDALSAEFTIPAAACDVLVEVAAEANGIGPGMRAFRAVQQHYPAGPTIHAFLPLVFRATDPVLLTVLAAEFLAAAVPDQRPKPQFYDKLIWGCAMTASLDVAFSLLTQMRKLTIRLPGGHAEPATTDSLAAGNGSRPPEWWMHLSGIPRLVKVAIELADQRVWHIIDALERALVDVREPVRKLMQLEGKSSPSPPSSSQAAAAGQMAGQAG